VGRPLSIFAFKNTIFLFNAINIEKSEISNYFCLKLKKMIATIELPNNTHERDFVLEVLKRLNIRFTIDNMSEDVEESVLEEHAAILRDRRKAMQSPDAQFYTWEQAQTVLANRKANKSI
jgi:hypothetical protein